MSSKIEVCAEAEKAITALTGFEFKPNELQTVSAGDLLAVYLAGRAAQSTEVELPTGCASDSPHELKRDIIEILEEAGIKVKK